MTASTTPGTGIARAGLLLLAGTIASRLLGLLRDVVVSARFGTSGDLDLYVAAFRVPDLAFTLVSGGALASALVPVFSHALHDRSRRPGGDETAGVDRLVRLARVTSLVVLVASTTLVVGVAAFADRLAPVLGAGFPPESQARLADLVRILLAQPALLGTGEVLARYLNVRGRFAATAFAPAAYTLGIVVAALLAPTGIGTEALAWGAVAGAAAYLAILAADSWRSGLATGGRSGPSGGSDLGHVRDELLRVLRLMVPRMVGQGAVQLSFVATTRIASFLPAGRLAALNYAWALAMLPLGAFAMTTASAAFPTFAAQAARGELAALAATGRRTMGVVSVAMFLAVAAAVSLGADAIDVLFGRQAFGAGSVALVAGALVAYSIGLPAHGLLEVQMRLAFALEDTRTPVAVGVAAMALNVALAHALAPAFGHVGIGLALSAAATVEAACLGYALERRLPGVHGDGFASLLARLAAVALVAGAAGWAMTGALRSGDVPALARLAAGGLAFVAVAAVGARFLRVPEVSDVARSVARRLPRVGRTAG